MLKILSITALFILIGGVTYFGSSTPTISAKAKSVLDFKMRDIDGNEVKLKNIKAMFCLSSTRRANAVTRRSMKVCRTSMTNITAKVLKF